MGSNPRGWILIGLLLSLMTAAATAQVTTTPVADTVYHADGTPATGTVLISWPAFTTATGEAIASGSTAATIAANGALSVNLTPNTGATPIGSYYTAVFHLDDGSVSREYWVVPVSSAPVRISAIESTVLPTSVAMQTVSKAYVDTAIAAATSGHPLDSTPYVLKAGDAMTGPLALPGDPVSPTQAADKNYVDENIAALSSGLGQKVSTLPTSTQTVTQPTGTELAANRLNDVEYASQYATSGNSNGIANAVSSPDCAAGCEVKVEQDYANESFSAAALNNQTHIIDARGGAQVDSYLNPRATVGIGTAAGQSINSVSTEATTDIVQQSGSTTPASIGMVINHSALAGGSNLAPGNYENVPYFKMAYSALQLQGTYNTEGQHGLMPESINCFGVGDCLLGSRFIEASGGWRDGADEGAHLYDTVVLEDSRVFEGTCITGCSAGSTSIVLRQDANAGTQGDGRFIIDMNPSKVISSQNSGGSIVNGFVANPHATVQFSGTNLPVSVFLSTGQIIPSQSNNMAPGTVTFQIATSGVPSGFATNTAAIGSSSGLACVVDQNTPAGADYEMAPYTVVDGTHLRMTFNKPHNNLATLSFGGLCGYGIEQTVDTQNGIRQVFPVIGAYTPTALYYDGQQTAVLGAMNQTDGFLNVNTPLASLVRSAGTVTITIAAPLPYDLTGLRVTVSGAADSSFNGTFPVTKTSSGTFTYTQSGADASTTGGTVSYLNGGFAIYPMAEVLSVFNPASKGIDGTMKLAPNNVAWASNDPVEEPHYFQEYISADTETYGQTVPRPTLTSRAGRVYVGNNSGAFTGWSINNNTPTSSYLGYGGTHIVPEAAYESLGAWQHNMDLTAGEQSIFTIHCNLHGCNNWNSGYNLFELQDATGYGLVHYDTQGSNLSINLRGSNYTFAPSGFTAGTINATTINAGTINGSVNAASINAGTIPATVLPVFGASGAAHAAGVVPDPGTTQGSTRYLREDGTWATPAGGGNGGSGTSGSVAITGGTIDGTTIGASAAAAVNATQLNGVPVAEYTNVPRKPLATLLQALHNANSQPVNIVVLSDSFGICDYANCGTGPAVSANRYTDQLRINLQAQYGSHGTGMVPLIAMVGGPTLNSEAWAVSGSWNAVNTLGPYQAANFAGSALVHLPNGAVATFTSSVPYDTINTYCMTSASTGSITVTIDGVQAGTACASATSTPTAHAVSSTAVTLGTHVTTFTSTGDSYLYAAEGTAGTKGVSVHNLAVGSAAAEWFGLNPATQLAFSDLIPGGTQGVVTMLQTNEPGVGYSVASFTSAMNAIIAHEQALPGSPSVMLVVPPVDVINGTAPYTAAQVSLAQQQNVALVNVQDRWGTTYVASSGLWDLGTAAPGIHPNDKGARDMYSMIYAGLVDPVPFSAAGATGSIAGLVTAGSGVTITGAGTQASPYAIAAAGGSGGGCSTGCTFGGTTVLNSGSGQNVLNMTSSSAGGPYFTMTGSAAGVHTQGFEADNFGRFLIGDFTAGGYALKTGMFNSTSGFAAVGSGEVFGFMPGYITNDTSTPDAAFSRTGAAAVALGNGAGGDASGSLSLGTLNAGNVTASGNTASSYFTVSNGGRLQFAVGTFGFSSPSAGVIDADSGAQGDQGATLNAKNVHASGVVQGPATAPSGACSVIGWAFSQDGHATFCNGSAWVAKI